ncbi:intrinsic membrane protein [Burkholderia phage vB_BglM_WTB]
MNLADLSSIDTFLTITASLALLGVIGGALGLGFLKLVGIFVPERVHG